jgi:hypothetical protein
MGNAENAPFESSTNDKLGKQKFCYFDMYEQLRDRRDSVVGVATGNELDDRDVGVRVPVGSRIIFSPRRPDRHWGPPNLLSNGYGWAVLPRG